MPLFDSEVVSSDVSAVIVEDIVALKVVPFSRIEFGAFFELLYYHTKAALYKNKQNTD